MFSRIFAAIISFFMWLFPCLQTTQPLDNETIANSVINAVKTRDIAAIEALMCKNIKDNVPNLTNEIGNLLDAYAISGEDFEFSWKTSGGYFESNGKGKSIRQNYIDIHITNATCHYLLIIVLETHNSFASDEMGIRSISIGPKTTPASDEFYFIRATEGVMEWHE